MVADPGTDEIRIGISSCLLGHEVRYDGGHKHDRFITGTLGQFVTFVPTCPEVEIGLGIPRESIRLERAGSTNTEALIQALRGGQFKTLLGDVTIRDFDGQATFGHHTGFTYTNPNYPFKRLRDVVRAEGEEVLHTREEVERIRQEAQKTKN